MRVYTFAQGEYIEWNGSATFNYYMNDKNVDCFTYNGATEDTWREIARNWLLENVYEVNEG
jgi:hypothetical protein